MSATLSPTQVRCRDDGRLTARCTRCGADLVQAPEADVRDALAALDRTHTATAHRGRVPEGWLPTGPADPDRPRPDAATTDARARPGAGRARPVSLGTRPGP